MIKLSDIQKQNIWKEKSESILPDGYINRRLCEKILPFLDRDEIVIILGPRQSGKTTLLNWFIQKYQELDIAKENIFYLNLDNKLLAAQLGEPLDFAEYFRSLKKQEGRVILMLDEVQRVSDAGLFLKNIYDAFKDDIKIFCSGSSSLEIKAKTKEHLTGRKKNFSLLPLSLKEIAPRNLAYLRNIDKIDFKILKKIQRLYSKDLEDVFNLYSRYGGYPKVFLAPNADLKNSLL
ncbi:MAG: AAA family ATPase, partial [Candidatus Omnitrophica bacterium]|nr:AAA family ATPase [Candidatus Omnitrophota bacterium]